MGAAGSRLGTLSTGRSGTFLPRQPVRSAPGGDMSFQDEFDSVAQEVLARVAAGQSLTLKLCQEVIRDRASAARPGAVLLVAAGLLPERVRDQRWAAG
jgi:hypothetical protein